MEVRINTRDFRRQMDRYIRASGKDVPTAINKQFPKLFHRAGQTAKRASRAEITAFGKSELARRVALSRARPDGRPMKLVAKDYIKRMLKQKRRAVGFLQLVIRDMGRSFKGEASRASRSTFQSRRASRSYHNAYVRYTHDFQGAGDRSGHVKEIQSAIDKSQAAAVRDMETYITRKLNRAARRRGL